MKKGKEKIALVTGANKGIGKEIVRQLAAKGISVYLTARDESRAINTYEELTNEYSNVLFHQLDVTDQKSVDKCRDYIKKEHGRLDILINNAGITDKGTTGLGADIEEIERIVQTNTYGPLRMCRAFVPMMIKNKYGRVVNISSRLGRLSTMEGRLPGYKISKAALNAVTRIIAEETAGKNVLVNAMCPGWTKTDIGGPKASRTVEEAADTAVWLATMRDGGATGCFFYDRKKRAW